MADIKNAKRKEEKRIQPKCPEEISVVHSWERTLPYFSVVVAQVDEDTRYQSLSRQDQGEFWRLVQLFWKTGGIVVDHSGAVANKLGLSIEEWQQLRQRLIDKDILMLSSDGFHLIQLELREQYLQTVENNNKMRRTITSKRE
jgi:uncharacterized protein YdaU (DUF1376 family)